MCRSANRVDPWRTYGTIGEVTAREIRFDVAAQGNLLDELIALGDRNNNTLGFMPFAGFRAAAKENRIALATTPDGTLLGYCLFDLPRDVVRIVQVCVSDTARGTGLARSLIEAVSVRHSDRLGLVLKCRADWPADRMWPKLGFVPQTQVPGRSKEKHPLTVWWRSHGHADLFSLLDVARSGRLAAIDSNVYSDLHSSRPRQGATHTAVIAPLIAEDELNLVLTPSLASEIYATPDPTERRRYLNAQVNYTKVSAAADDTIVDHLLQQIPASVLSRDPSLRSDAQFIAEAYANDIDLFITRDGNAVHYLSRRASELGVQLLHPSEVPTHLDVERSKHAYAPVQLEETTFVLQRLDRALTADEIAILLNRPDGERLANFRQMLANAAGRSTKDVQRMALFDGSNNLVALWSEVEGPSALEVPLLRIPDGRMQTTLAAQISSMLRNSAIRRNKHVVRISDDHLAEDVQAIFDADGYYPDSEGLVALTIPHIGSWAGVSAAAQTMAENLDAEALHQLLELPENPSLLQTVELERIWAPAKIMGQGIPNFLVPIKPAFAAQLLGYPMSLMSRSDDLGLSREHVYYSSRRGPLVPPARILWYVSGRVEPAIIASSSLVEIRVDTPERLHRLYARLGVWTLSDITTAAAKGVAAAIRFADTELFSSPVGLNKLRALAPEGRQLLLRSAQRMDDDWYERIYREGTGR